MVMLCTCIIQCIITTIIMLHLLYNVHVVSHSTCCNIARLSRGQNLTSTCTVAYIVIMHCIIIIINTVPKWLHGVYALRLLYRRPGFNCVV